MPIKGHLDVCGGTKMQNVFFFFQFGMLDMSIESLPASSLLSAALLTLSAPIFLAKLPLMAPKGPKTQQAVPVFPKLDKRSIYWCFRNKREVTISK